MELHSNNLNTSVYKGANLKQHRFAASEGAPSFGGGGIFKVQKTTADILSDVCIKYAGEINDASKNVLKDSSNIRQFLVNGYQKTRKFFRENFVTGTNVTYTNKAQILNGLKKNFGDTFDDCFEDIMVYNSADSALRSQLFGVYKNKIPYSSKFKYITDSKTDSIMFHKEPFIKNMFDGVKEFTVGTVLDMCVYVRKIVRRANGAFGKKDIISSSTSGRHVINSLLDRRIVEKEAKDSFYKLTGVFESIQDAIDKAVKKELESGTSKSGSDVVQRTIDEHIKTLAHDSIKSASKKVGKYNTKTERAWNRLGTGFVSALFAKTDFYNISMLQNNDPAQAEASGNKRFMQDMRRQGLTAAITYVILGAFQKKTNSSILYAALSLGGVTLISEILSRVMGGIPLTPLTPEEAAETARKNSFGKKQKEKPEAQVTNIEKTQKEEEQKPLNFNVFKAFTEHFNNSAANTDSSASYDKNIQKKDKKKTNLPLKILKGVAAIMAASLAVGALRSKNVFGIDDIIKNCSAKYKEIIFELTKKRLILAQDDVDGFLNFLNDNNFEAQYKELCKFLEPKMQSGMMSGQSKVIRKYMPKKEIDLNGSYYDFGFVESKGKKTIANVLLYPVNTVSKLMQKINNLVKMFFGVKPENIKTGNEEAEMALSFIEKYANKYKDAALNGDIDYSFRKEIEDAFSRHFSEANSRNKNTSLAMISRFLITIISGYFFVNDYRNEVLIESEGKDVEGANATMRERIGHKVANFFLNSMFMDLFNSTFENIYLSSVAGATAVAMATEFTNETAVRASICTPTSKMTREELIEYENKRLNNEGPKGDYYRAFMKLTGKKPLSEKAKKD